MVVQRELVTLTWSDAVVADGRSSFERNQRVFRADGRFGLKSKRPWAFCAAEIVEPAGS